MSTENEDLSESLAAELTGSIGMDDHGDNAPDDVLDAVAEQELHLAEKDLAMSTDQEDTKQGELDREAEQEQGRQRNKKVPLAALHEERTKRQAIELEAQQLRQQLQQFMAQQQAAQQAQQQAQQEAAIPDFDEDPRGHVEAVKQQFKQEIENLKNGQGQEPQFAQVQAQLDHDRATVLPAAIQLEAEFSSTVPDYPAAFDFVQQSAEAQLRAQYPQADPAQFDMLRTVALVGFNKQCLANGINPAAHIYKRAQEMGFKPARRAPRVEPPTSLANAHGSSRAPDERSSVHASDIANMTEKEFDDFFNSMRRSSVQRPAI
jgi:hypothetical protein